MVSTLNLEEKYNRGSPCFDFYDPLLTLLRTSINHCLMLQFEEIFAFIWTYKIMDWQGQYHVGYKISGW